MKIKSQILFSFLFIILLNSALLSLLAYRQSARVIQRNVASASNRAVQLVEYNLQRQLQSYDDLIYQVFLSDPVQRWFNISEREYRGSQVLSIQREVTQNTGDVTALAAAGDRADFTGVLHGVRDAPRQLLRLRMALSGLPLVGRMSDNTQLFISPVYQIDREGAQTSSLPWRAPFMRSPAVAPAIFFWTST
jgi:hypothetical protein